MDENAKLLRKSFRVPSKEQINKTAKRILKTNKLGETVVDKNVLALLRTYKYKQKLAKELEEGSEKPPTD
jgi:Pyruvate/2-oxoacid:ferredoxin oxidoreductase gamma subunit